MLRERRIASMIWIKWRDPIAPVPVDRSQAAATQPRYESCEGKKP